MRKSFNPHLFVCTGSPLGGCRPHCDVGFADALNPLAVKVERVKGGSSRRGQSDDFQPVFRPAKVIFPGLSPRVKEGCVLSCIGVGRLNVPTFTPVAVKTGERKVLRLRQAAQTHRDDVVNRKGNVLPGLVGVTILAQRLCPPPDLSF